MADRPFRRLRFFVLERLFLPAAIVPLRLLVRSWRVRCHDDAALAEAARCPRVVVATYHGMLLHLLAFSRVFAAQRRRLVVMLAPSLDGRLLAAMLRYFDVDHVSGTSGSRSVGGAVDLIGRVRAGDIAVVAADGPLGPCCVAKAGVVRMAAAARASLLLAVTSAGPGLRLGSWDRAHLPLPFARVDLALHLLPMPTGAGVDATLVAAQATLVAAARRLNSPVLPPGGGKC